MRQLQHALVSLQMLQFHKVQQCPFTLETWRNRPQLCSKSNNKKERQTCEANLIYFTAKTQMESGYCTAGLRFGIFEVLLVTACVCTGAADDGDRNCKYQTWQMSSHSRVSGISQLEEEILKRWRHNRKLFIASVLSAAELTDGCLLFSVIRCVVPYTHWQAFSLCVNISQQQKQSLVENNNTCLCDDTYAQYAWKFQRKRMLRAA